MVESITNHMNHSNKPKAVMIWNKSNMTYGDGPINSHHFLLMCLNQARKVSGRVFVCWGIDFASINDFPIVLTV